MLKPVKIILSIIASLVFMTTIAVLTAYFLIDPNNYKPEIVAAVKEKTGKELNLIGELKLSVFPWLGISTGKMTLSNSRCFQITPAEVYGCRKIQLLIQYDTAA